MTQYRAIPAFLSSQRQTIGVVVLLFLAISLRLVDINGSFWEDECYEYLLGAARPFWHSLTYQPYPVYHVLSHACLWFGNSEWVIRIPSLLAGVMGVWTIQRLGARLYGPTAGLIAGLLLATSSFHIWHSREARFYAWVMLGAILSVHAMVCALESNRKRDWTLCAAAGNLMNLSHLMAVPFWLALLAGAMSGTLATWRHSTWKRCAAITVCGLLGLTGICATCAVRHATKGTFVEWGIARNAGNDISQDGVIQNPHGPAWRLTVTKYGNFWKQFFSGFPPVLRWTCVAIGCAGLVHLWQRSRLRAIMMMALLLLPPIPFFLLAFRHWFAARYFCAMLPPALVLIAGGVSWLIDGQAKPARNKSHPSLAKWVITVLLVALFMPTVLASLHAQYNGTGSEQIQGFGFPARIHVKEAAMFIARAASPYDIVAPAQPWQPRTVEWSYYARRYIHPNLIEPIPEDGITRIWWVDRHGLPPTTKELPFGTLATSTKPVARFLNAQVFVSECRLPGMHEWLTGFNTQSWRETEASQVTVLWNRANSITVNATQDNAYWAITTDPIPVGPRAVIELTCGMSGPPLARLSFDFLDATHQRIDSVESALYDLGPVSHRNWHPALVAPDISAERVMRLAAITPANTRMVIARLEVTGATRKNDSLSFYDARLRAGLETKE